MAALRPEQNVGWFIHPALHFIWVFEGCFPHIPRNCALAQQIVFSWVPAAAVFGA